MPSPAQGDCGSVPFYAPFLVDLGDPEDRAKIKFDPLEVSVFEPRQRAIILWNGEEEILLLSTDQRATQHSAVLEVIPLPAKPRVRLGSFETFEVAQRLVIEKHLWACAHPGATADLLRAPKPAGRIAFHEKLGAHNLTVAEVLDGDRFVSFVQSYLQQEYRTSQAPIRSEFVQIVQSYVDECFRWFALDVIELDGTTKSRQPIEYRFKSDCVYYPMRISTLERGETEVDLLVFSTSGANRFEGLKARQVKASPELDVTREEISVLKTEWSDLFPAEEPVKMDRWRIKGDLASFASDIRVK